MGYISLPRITDVPTLMFFEFVPAPCRRAAAALMLCVCACRPAMAAEPAVYDCIITPDRVVEVGAAAVGVLEEVRVERGDRVHVGDVIAVLESGVEEAAVALARFRAGTDSEIRARQVTLALQRSNADRSARLHATHAIADKTRDEAEHDARLSSLRLHQAEEDKRLAELELVRAERALARRTIVSPVDGVVTERHRSPGERVEEQPIVTIARLHPLRVEVVLPVDRYGAVVPGMSARVVPEYATEGQHLARVHSVDAVLDAASGTFGVQLTMPNPAYSLPGGLRCSLTFLERTEAPVMSDPAASTEVPGSPDDAASAEPPESSEPPASSAEPRLSSVPDAGAPISDQQPVRGPQVPAVAESVPTSDIGAMDPGDTTAERALRPAASPVSLSAAMPERCIAFGPIAERRRAEGIRRALARRDISVRTLQAHVERPQGYLVIVDAKQYPGGTGGVTSTLKRMGFSDFQVLTSRPDAVSVGYFMGHATAVTRAQRMHGMGLQARVVPRMRRLSEYVLEIDLSQAADTDARLRQVLRANGMDAGDAVPCQGMTTAQR